MLKVHLVRHGEVHNPEGLMYGRLPNFTLSEKGVGEAKRTGELMRDVLLRDQGSNLVAMYHSPMIRAKITAENIRSSGDLNHVDLEENTLINEVNLNYYEGMLQREVGPKTQWRLYQHVPSEHRDNNETARQVMDRLISFFKAMHAKHFPREALDEEEKGVSASPPVAEVIAVSHADPVYFSHVWAKGAITNQDLGPDHRWELGFNPTHCSVSTFVFEDKDVSKPTNFHYFSHTY